MPSPAPTLAKVVLQLRKLRLARITASSLETMRIVGEGDGEGWVQILLKEGHLRQLPAEELSRSTLKNPYDVVRGDGSLMRSKKYVAPMVRVDSEVVRGEPVAPDPKWMDFWFHHPDFCHSPLWADLYILSRGQDVKFAEFCAVIRQYNLGDSWIPNRLCRGRRLGHIDPNCKGSPRRPLVSILWNQDQIPDALKQQLARLLLEYQAIA